MTTWANKAIGIVGLLVFSTSLVACGSSSAGGGNSAKVACLYFKAHWKDKSPAHETVAQFKARIAPSMALTVGTSLEGPMKALYDAGLKSVTLENSKQTNNLGAGMSVLGEAMAAYGQVTAACAAAGVPLPAIS